MYKITEVVTKIFDEDEELKRIRECFEDDPDLVDLLTDITNLVLKNDFDEAMGLTEILEGHSDHNPLEYLHHLIFDAIFDGFGEVKFTNIGN